MNRLHRELIHLLRDVAPIVLVGVLVFHLLRTHVMQWYLVPTASMEPTLHGDPHHGDVVLVDKTAYWFHPPRTWDIVVVRQPAADGAEDHLVKRLVCLAEDRQQFVSIDDGDVHVGDSRLALRVVRKHPLVNADMLVTWLQLPAATLDEGGTAAGHGLGPADAHPRNGIGSRQAGPGTTQPYRGGAFSMLVGPGSEVPAGSDGVMQLPAAAEDGVELAALAATPVQPAAPAGHVGTRFPIDTSFLDCHGRRQAVAWSLVRDGGAELRLRLGPHTTGVQLLLDQDAVRFAFTWAEGQAQGTVRRDGVPIGSFPAPLLHGDLHLQWGWLDGQLFLVAGDDVLVLQAVELPPRELPQAHQAGARPGIGCRVWFAVAGPHRAPAEGDANGGAGAVVTALRVFHDVWYRADVEPFRRQPIGLEPGEMWLLGDNTFDSTDSRLRGAFAAADLVGQPIAILAPHARARWLR